MSSAYLKFVILLLPIFTVPSKQSREFLIITSECMLNKCGDKIHPCRTPCSVLMSTVNPCVVLDEINDVTRESHFKNSFPE